MILFLGSDDWANVSNRVARSINVAAGHSAARVLTVRSHPFGYQEDVTLDRDDPEGAARLETLREGLSELKWVVSTGDGDYGSFWTLVDRLKLRRPGVRFATAHVGSAYRLNAETYNNLDASMRFAKRFIGGDLYRFASSDPTAVPYFAPPHSVSPRLPEPLPLDGPVRIGHSPTARARKGTADILRVLESFRGRAEIDLIEGVGFEECVRRRAHCHIFVDQLQADIGGYGASSVEAMAWGCATLADIHNVSPLVNAFYPAPPIIDVPTPQDLVKKIDVLLEDPHVLTTTREQSYGWACAHASPQAVGDYWLRHLS